MRVVAIRANYFACFNRMIGDFVAIRPLLLVAAEANFRLCLLRQYWVSRFMNLVTVIASNTVVLVLSTIPMGALAAFVAADALPGALFVIRDGESALLEDNIWSGTAFDGWVTLQVLFAGTVARLARGRAFIASDTMLGLVERQHRSSLAFVVALGAECIFSERLFCHGRF